MTIKVNSDWQWLSNCDRSLSVHLANDPFAAQTGRSLSPAVWRHSKTRKYYYQARSFNFISRIPLRPAQNLPIDVAHFNVVCEVSVGNARDRFGLGTEEYGVQGTDQQAADTRQMQVPGTYIIRVKLTPRLGRHMISLISIDHQVSNMDTLL